MMKQQHEDEDDVHPMIPVPEAIRMVLRETARCILLIQNMNNNNNNNNMGEEEDTITSASSVAYTSTGGSFVESVTVIDHTLIGRIVAQDITMPEPGYPPFAASILDGYAIRRHELLLQLVDPSGSDNNNNKLTIIGRVHAGDDWEESEKNTMIIASSDDCDRGIAIYVTTGAKIPNGGFDGVVAVEDTIVEETTNGNKLLTIKTMPTTTTKTWIRAPGSDIPAHTKLMKAGDIITPVEVGLLLQAACTSVAIRKRIRVGIVSTGNELVSQNDKEDRRRRDWLTERNGYIPDVNGPMLMGLLESMFSKRVEAKGFGVERDDSEAELAEALRVAASQSDILITTGGISTGDADLIETVMVHRLGGTLHFGRLHMKPGKPSTFLTLPDHTLAFCLPGNPVSAYVCAMLLVQPCIDLLCQGIFSIPASSAPPDTRLIEDMVENALVVSEEQISLPHDIVLDFERPEYHRVKSQTFESTGVQQSSRLLSCQHSAGLVLVPQATMDQPVAKKGEVHILLKIHDSARIRVRDSLHLKPANPDHGDRLRVTLLQFGPVLDQSLSDAIERDLRTGIRNDTVQRVFHLLEHRCITSLDWTNDDFSSAKQDLTILVGPSESLRSYSLLASYIHSSLTKHADAMALQVMQHCTDSPVRECVIGSKAESGLIIFVSSIGLKEGIPNIRDVLIQAVRAIKES